MGEKCKYAYRKPGKNAVFCKKIEGDMDYCIHTYMCPATQRWEADKTAQCEIRKKAKA